MGAEGSNGVPFDDEWSQSRPTVAPSRHITNWRSSHLNQECDDEKKNTDWKVIMHFKKKAYFTVQARNNREWKRRVVKRWWGSNERKVCKEYNSLWYKYTIIRHKLHSHRNLGFSRVNPTRVARSPLKHAQLGHIAPLKWSWHKIKLASASRVNQEVGCSVSDRYSSTR